MLTVNELSIQSGSPAHVVRYYTRIGLIHPHTIRINGYRMFSQDTVNHVRFIRVAKQLGFSLCEIHQIISGAAKGKSPCPEVRKMIDQRVVTIRSNLDSMIRLHAWLTLALENLGKLPGGIPDGRNIRYLIEKQFDRQDTIVMGGSK